MNWQTYPLSISENSIFFLLDPWVFFLEYFKIEVRGDKYDDEADDDQSYHCEFKGVAYIDKKLLMLLENKIEFKLSKTQSI